MHTTLVVLAAGIGRRYGGLKQLEPVGPSGEALLEYSIFDAARAGFGPVVLVVRPETEKTFQDILSARVGGRVDLSYVHQTLSDLPGDLVPPRDRTKPWGTGHAVLAASGVVNGPFAVINADDFYGSHSFAAVGEFLRTAPTDETPTFALVGFAVGPTLSDAGPVSRGLCRADSEGWLETIVEVPELHREGAGGRYQDDAGVEHSVSGDELVSMNMWGFTPTVFPLLGAGFRRFLESLQPGAESTPEFLLPAAVQGMIDDGSARVHVLPHSGQWCGITFAEDRDRVTAFIADLVARGEYPSRLWR